MVVGVPHQVGAPGRAVEGADPLRSLARAELQPTASGQLPTVLCQQRQAVHLDVHEIRLHVDHVLAGVVGEKVYFPIREIGVGPGHGQHRAVQVVTGLNAIGFPDRCRRECHQPQVDVALVLVVVPAFACLIGQHGRGNQRDQLLGLRVYFHRLDDRMTLRLQRIGFPDGDPRGSIDALDHDLWDHRFGVDLEAGDFVIKFGTGESVENGIPVDGPRGRLPEQVGKAHGFEIPVLDVDHDFQSTLRVRPGGGLARARGGRGDFDRTRVAEDGALRRH